MIVITGDFQFFEGLFGCPKGNVRRLHPNLVFLSPNFSYCIVVIPSQNTLPEVPDGTLFPSLFVVVYITLLRHDDAEQRPFVTEKTFFQSRINHCYQN